MPSDDPHLDLGPYGPVAAAIWWLKSAAEHDLLPGLVDNPTLGGWHVLTSTLSEADFEPSRLDLEDVELIAPRPAPLADDEALVVFVRPEEVAELDAAEFPHALRRRPVKLRMKRTDNRWNVESFLTATALIESPEALVDVADVPDAQLPPS